MIHEKVRIKGTPCKDIFKAILFGIVKKETKKTPFVPDKFYFIEHSEKVEDGIDNEIKSELEKKS